MTKSEMNRFRAILTAKVAELVRFTSHRDGIGLSEAPINWTRSRRLLDAGNARWAQEYLRLHQGFFGNRFHGGPEEFRCPYAGGSRRRRLDCADRCGGPRLGEAREGRHSESLYRRAPRLDGYT
jgi:hypothetical protein